MIFEKDRKYYVRIIAVSLIVIIAAVAFSVWTHIKPDKSIPTLTALALETTQPAVSMFEDEWEKKYAAELEAAQKAVREANARYESAEAERNALSDELDITQTELENALVDLQSKTPPELDITAIKEKYGTVGELVTINYEYEYTSKASDNGKALSIFGSGDLIFWDTKEFLYKVSGSMKLGVDLSATKEGLTIDTNNKSITLTIPAAYVIANDPDELNVERYDIQKGWLNSNPVTDKDLLDAFTALEDELKQRVQENGMLKYAQELAGYQIKELLQPIASISGYSISLKYST